MDERQLLLEVLADLQKHGDVEYADLRLVADATERLRVRNARLENCDTGESVGVGVRVVADGAWGFAATPGADPARVRAAALAARAVARASARAGGARVRLAPLDGPPATGRYETPVARDPFAVSLDEKVRDLAVPTERILRAGRPVRAAEGRMLWTRQRKRLVTSDGVDVEQHLTFGSAGIWCVAVGDDGRAQRRSHPCYLDGDAAQGGYERVAAMRLAEESERVREEAVALLAADPAPAGARTVILESSQLALQIHESCGHPAELDRALGTEISLAGGSFLQPGMLGSFRYGDARVNLTADATSPGGLGTFGWDDEGVAARAVPIVREGIFVGYLSSRETAARLGVAPSGAMRADGWGRAPLIRMVNVNLEPDPHGPSLDELIADTDDGLYLATNKSWSIDDLRLNFQFGCEVAWEIKKGRRVRMLRDAVYTGITPRFWGRCDAICGPREWRLWGILNCGKGEPMQTMQVGHGTAPARFTDVEVGHG